MATWAERRDAYVLQERERRRQEEKRNRLAQLMSQSYTPESVERVETPMFGPTQTGAALPPAIEERRTPGGMNWQTFMDTAFRSGMGPEALQIASQMNPQTKNEYTLGEIGAGGDQVQSVIFNKQTGKYEPVGDVRRKSSAPDWMLPGYFDAIKRKGEIEKGNKPNKPMPATALKMQQEELDAIGLSSGISSDLSQFQNQIETGALDLGLFSNLANQARNFAGQSTPESQALASFKSTLEKLRNDTLRLNKGVQTEGDAQRAWNELLANMNDPEVVKNRLQEIQNINERAVGLRKMNVDNIRMNYGLDPLETQGYENLPPAIIDKGSKPGYKIPKGARTATDSTTGKKVFTIDGKTFFDAETGKRVE